MREANCLSCGESFSTEDDRLICVLNKDDHIVVDEDHSCDDFN
ncbi:hypothetical protein ACK8P5_26265 (plasmid) [Paenibacillus sp. EC2-1]